MPSFSAWVRDARLTKRLTQTECAKRAGMKLQQWNEIEKHDREPKRATVLAVARALEIPEEVAMVGAGYMSQGILADEAQCTAEIEHISRRVPLTKRSLYWRLLKHNAEMLSNALASE